MLRQVHGAAKVKQCTLALLQIHPRLDWIRTIDNAALDLINLNYFFVKPVKFIEPLSLLLLNRNEVDQSVGENVGP